MRRKMSRFATTLVAIVVLAVGLVVSPLATPRTYAAAAVDLGVVGPTAFADFLGAPLGSVTSPAPTTVLHLYLGLVADLGDIAARARAVSDPMSPSYLVHGSVVEEAARANASDGEISAVVSWFATRGVVMRVDPTRSYVQGDVPVGIAGEALGAAIGQYSITGFPADVVALTPVSVPTALAAGLAGKVNRVYGASLVYDTTTSRPWTPAGVGPRNRVLSAPEVVALAPAGGGSPWRTGVASDACPAMQALTYQGRPIGLSPGQLRAAYGIDALWSAGFRGRGSRIAVVDQSLYRTQDLADYRACFGVEGTAITPHIIGTPALDGGSDETTLDLEVMTAIAPEAERIDWYAVNTASGVTQSARVLFDMLVAPLDPATTGGVPPDVISSSFGNCEPFLVQEDPGFAPMAELLDQVLETAAAGGVGVFVASFDDGSSGCFRFLPAPEKFQSAVVWPSTSPWVTAVGGTNLALAADNTVVSSGVWNDSSFGQVPTQQQPEVGGGGGGESLGEDRPWYQTGPGVTAGSTRLVPDVAAFSDPLPGYMVVIDGSPGTIGGTSAATPLTAGAFALLASARREIGRPGLGFVNPLLYSLARSGRPVDAATLRDITIGTNDVYGIGVYAATAGFDRATGLGSPRFENLLSALAAPDPAPVPEPEPEPVRPRFTG